VTALSAEVPVVELRGLGRRFPGDPPVDALADVDLVVRRGDYLSVVGPSGSGKSTLLHILGCLDRPTTGAYLLDGVDVAELSEAQRTAQRGQRLGFVFQSFHLLPYRTACENVMTAGLYNRTSRRDRRERAEAALDRVGLAHRTGALPGTLSGGERQRVAIARALVSAPSLLLCDEPTGNLDTANTGAILDLFDDLRADGLTLLVITHDEAVSRRADRVVGMVDGRLREAGTWSA
jgi:putative ABC transport system ATP-binding protein